jgi:hypothetical protein
MNALELRAVCLALQQFLPYLEGKHVLVRFLQHHGSIVYQSTGGTEITAPPQNVSEALAVGSDPLSFTTGSAHPRGLEPGSGHAFEKHHTRNGRGPSVDFTCWPWSELKLFNIMLPDHRP